MKRHWPITITAAVAAFTALVVALYGGTTQKDGEEPGASPATTPELSSLPATLTFIGRATYTFRYEAEGSLSLQGESGTSPANQAVSARLGGTLVLDSDGGSVGHAELHSLAGTISAAGNVLPLPTEPTGMSLGFSPDGAIVSLHFQKASPTWVENLARTLLALWRVRQAPCVLQKACWSWTLLEHTPFGRIQSEYRLLPIPSQTPETLRGHEGAPHFQLQRKVAPAGAAHVQGETQAQAALLAGIAGGRQSFVPYSLDGKITTRNEAAGVATGGSTTAIHAELVSYTPSFGNLNAASAAAPARPAPTSSEDAEASTLGGISTSQNARDFLEKTLGGMGAGEVLAELDSLLKRTPGRRPSPQESMNTYLKLKALALSHPESLPELANALRNAPSDSATWELVAGALLASGSEEAQATLVEVAKERRADVSLTTRIVVLLASTDVPLGAAARSFLDDLVRSPSTPAPLRTTSELAWGVATRTSAAQDAQWAAATARSIEASLTQATSEREIIHWLAVAGNAATTNLLPHIRAHLESPFPAVRAQAVFSLRFQDPSSVQPLIFRALQDGNASVRTKAIEALAFVPPSSDAVEVLALQYRREPDASVRLRLLAALWQLRPSSPTAEEQVRFAAQRDTEPKVRQFALSLVGERATP